MRGQSYTLFNYLVWVAFAMAFLFVAYAAYKAVVRPAMDISNRQLRDFFKSLAEVHNDCKDLPGTGSVLVRENYILSKDGIERLMGVTLADITYCVGSGAVVEGDRVRFTADVRAQISACHWVDGSGHHVKVCINRPFSCQTADPLCPG